MRRVIVGTAGHIDHGKTSLVERLTGIDCDRWAAEKERGITIDLGFAHLERGDLQVGFVDVPGHERFLHNALAGLGGIRVMLLVVAADEGVKPQTREHLAICSLLGIPAAVVALTKTDLVAEDLVELARLEVEELLEPGPFAGSPVVAVSSLTGAGVGELERRLLALAERHAVEPEPDRPARLPVDRAFHLKGLGVVVTGTLVSGSLRAGDELTLLPAGAAARVRSVQVHGGAREEAVAGERTALQLTGPALGAIERGQVLAPAGAFAPGRTLAVRCELLPEAPKPLRGATPIRLHLYSSETVGNLRPLDGAIEPGATGVAELRLAAPVVAVRGDRFILRRPSPPATLGGGVVLDPSWRRRRGAAGRRAAEALAGGDDDALELWVAEAGEAGAEAAPLARRLGRPAAEVAAALDRLAAADRLLRIAAGPGGTPRWLDPRAYARVAERARRVLDDYFRRDRLARGVPKAEAVRRILPGGAAPLAGIYFDWLARQRILAVEGELVNLPGRAAELTGEESELGRKLVAAYAEAGLTPPSPAEVARRLGAKPQIVDGLVRYLVERGRLVRLPGDLLIAGSEIERVRSELEGSAAERFSVPEFKDRFGISRKWAIPILEHLDSVGATRRVGNERLVVRRKERS